MGVAEKAVAYIELEDYLVLENASRHKHEYLDGVIYAVQGETVLGRAGGSADVLVHCGANHDPVNTMELTDARMVVEVLSPGTQNFDRGQKLAAYRKLQGLQHIVLLSSLEEAAWSCHRVPAGGEWSELLPWPRGSALDLAGLGFELPWDEVYGGVGLR